MSLSGTEYLVTISTRSATCTAPVSADRIAVLVLLAPKFYLFFLGALDAPLAHLDIILDLSLRELAVLPENDIEAQTENTQSDEH